MPDFCVREMHKEEYPLLEDFLYEAIFVPEGMEPPPRKILAAPELRVYTDRFGEFSADRCFAAEVNGKIAGAVWARIMDDYGHIDNDTPSLAILVYEEYRGRGIGTALMRAMLRELENSGYERVSLSVQKENRAAGLYRRLGFETVRETDEEYIMVKNFVRNDKMYDCCLTKENRWFRYRAAAIIVEDGQVLFAGNENEDYYYSIGGGVHMGETAEEAVLREVYEETGVRYEIDRMAVIHENFFCESGGVLKGLDCHEVAFYFLMKPRGTRLLNSDSYTCGVKEEMVWIPIGELDMHRAYPSFLKDFLSREHSGIEHIVTDERKK